MINAPFTHCAGCCHYYNGICNSLDKCPHQVVEMYQPSSREKEIAREFLSWAERVAKPTYYNVDDNPRMESLVLLSDIYKFFKEKFGVEVEND